MPTNATIGERDLTSRGSTALAELIASSRQIVRGNCDAGAVGRGVADALRRSLCACELLTPEQLEPDPAKYRQHVLHVEPDGSFSIAALVWMPGQATPIHDHVSWCAVGVYRGDEYETRYELRSSDGAPHLVEVGQTINAAGFVDALVPPGDIHRVANNGDGVAVSLHVYGADLGVLGCSIRHEYDLPVR